MSESPVNFHIILYQPEIPNNTGNIGRTCVATNCHLHLIGPLGFSIDEKAVRRAGLDYWKFLEVSYYENYDEFLERAEEVERIYFFSTKSDQNYTEIPFQKGDGLMFGPETRGLPEELWRPRSAQCYSIPMPGRTRSLNLSNAVAVVAFEGLRQLKI